MDQPLQVQTDILEKERNSSDTVSHLAAISYAVICIFLQVLEFTPTRTDSFVMKANGKMDTNMVLYSFPKHKLNLN